MGRIILNPTASTKAQSASKKQAAEKNTTASIQNDIQSISASYTPVPLDSESTSFLLGNTKKENIKKAHQSADKLKKFFRSIIAEKAYRHLFNNSAMFQSNNAVYALNENESALKKFNKLSSVSLNTIQNHIGPLSPEEEKLKASILAVAWRFRHQTNAKLDKENKLNLFSTNMQNKNGAHITQDPAVKNQQSVLYKSVSNDDFIFFGVETAAVANIASPVLNTKILGIDFGATAYLIKEQDHRVTYGYLTLTSHVDNVILPAEYHEYHEHQELVYQFPVCAKEIARRVTEPASDNTPMFSTQDMKVAVAYYLIDFLRKTKDTQFKNFAINCPAGSKELDRVINFVFQLEFHIPRMVSTYDYGKHIIRTPLMSEIIRTSDIELLDEHIHDKPQALLALVISIKDNNEKMVLHLLNKFNFSKSDFVIENNSDADGRQAIKDKRKNINVMLWQYKMTNDMTENPISVIARTLARPGRSIKVLDAFLSKGMIDVDVIFLLDNRKSTMLGYAARRKNKEMVKLLLKHNADSSLVASKQEAAFIASC